MSVDLALRMSDIVVQAGGAGIHGASTPDPAFAVIGPGGDKSFGGFSRRRIMTGDPVESIFFNFGTYSAFSRRPAAFESVSWECLRNKAKAGTLMGTIADGLSAFPAAKTVTDLIDDQGGPKSIASRAKD
jgi:hypothetical protein